MIRNVTICLILCALATVPARAQQPTAVPDPQLDPAILDNWGVKCYEWLERRQVSDRVNGGTINTFPYRRLCVVLTATWLYDGKVRIVDDWPVRYEHRRLVEKVTAATDNYLSTEVLNVHTSYHHVVAVAEGGKLKITTDGAPRTEDFPPKTLTLPTFMRLVTILPRDANVAYSPRQWLDSPEMEMNGFGDQPVICAGPDKVRVHGLEYDCTKYIHGPYTAWVRNFDSVLLQLDMPGYKRLRLLKDGDCCSGKRLEDFVERYRTRLEAADADAAAPPTN